MTSPALLEELRRVLSYPKPAAAFDDPRRLTELVGEVAVVVDPQISVQVVTDDAGNRVLEVAVTAQVDVVVTGDTDLLSLGSYDGIRMVTPKAFLDLLSDREVP